MLKFPAVLATANGWHKKDSYNLTVFLVLVWQWHNVLKISKCHSSAEMPDNLVSFPDFRQRCLYDSVTLKLVNINFVTFMML